MPLIFVLLSYLLEMDNVSDTTPVYFPPDDKELSEWETSPSKESEKNIIISTSVEKQNEIKYSKHTALCCEFNGTMKNGQNLIERLSQ